MKTCSICGMEYSRGGGPGPKDEMLCPAHYTRFTRGSPAWRDPMVQGSAAELDRLRVSVSTKERLERAYAKALKTRPALPFYAFADEVLARGLAS